MMNRHRWGLRVGAAVLSAGRALRLVVPPGVRRGLEDRVFGTIFEVTRVTNDHYPTAGPSGPASPPTEVVRD